jgi:anthranilate phosphoribosyltransferase
MRAYLRKIADGERLTAAESESALLTMMRGEASVEEIAGFLLGLRSRGETVDELEGCVRAMRACCLSINVEDPNAIDLCGTGGDQLGTFNISTTASFVVAGAGATVAKHGNRSVSSQSGSADVLEALGVHTVLSPVGVEECISKTGIGFLFAPAFHPALRHVMPVRRSLGVRTMFNIMGPMCNPAMVRRQLIGVFDPGVARMVASILLRLGAEHVITVHASDGLDEITLTGPTTLHVARSGMVEPETVEFHPEKLGFTHSDHEALKGGSAEDNADIVHSILSGDGGPRRDVVVINAAHALLVAGLVDTVEAGIQAASESIDSGAARDKLDQLREATILLKAA